MSDEALYDSGRSGSAERGGADDDADSHEEEDDEGDDEGDADNESVMGDGAANNDVANGAHHHRAANDGSSSSSVARKKETKPASTGLDRLADKLGTGLCSIAESLAGPVVADNSEAIMQSIGEFKAQ